jgi:predicted TIM-barrel fold metal-dependent hydrolase
VTNRDQLLLQDFRPTPKLVVKSTRVDQPRFPVFDAHNHLGEEFGGGWDHKPITELLDLLDQAGVVHYIDLDGGWGEDILHSHLAHFKEKAPERFSIFGGVDWSQWEKRGSGFPEWAAGRLQVQKAAGAEGLKIWKGLGLKVRDQDGSLVKVNDQRLSPIWESAGELNLPVIIHVADPVAFFDTLDETNERWEELQVHPEWAFPNPPYPPFEEILSGFRTLVGDHPQTLFIGAHVGCYAENLAWVGEMLDNCPNYFIDFSARMGELGRQPYSAREFFIRYQDRILFGSDLGPDLEAYRLYYRFLETDDEYFNYSPGDVPLQGRWYVHGIHLPEEVLEKIYFKNARRMLEKSHAQ